MKTYKLNNGCSVEVSRRGAVVICSLVEPEEPKVKKRKDVRVNAKKTKYIANVTVEQVPLCAEQFYMNP